MKPSVPTRRAVEREGHRARMRGHWRLAIAVGLLSPASYILVLTALKMGAPLHVVAPTREMSMMAGALFGMIFLGEAVGRWRLAGCVLLSVGVVLLSRGGPVRLSAPQPDRQT